MNHLENLKVLRATVAAQPDDVLNLDAWCCGTHFCIGGLATTVPHFQAMGIEAVASSGAPVAPSLGMPWPEEALNHFFKAFPGASNHATYDCIFEQAGCGLWDSELNLVKGAGLSHKELALARLDKAIALWEAV